MARNRAADGEHRIRHKGLQTSSPTQLEKVDTLLRSIVELVFLVAVCIL